MNDMIGELTQTVVIFTAIIGSYDSLRSPKIIPENVDFVCFTDSGFKSEIPAPWRRITLPMKGRTQKDLARYCKINAHEMLPNHKISIWVDGNIEIIGDIATLLEKYKSEPILASYEHWGRSNVTDEFIACAKLGFDNAWSLYRQDRLYISSGFRSNQLFETNVLIRTHNHPSVIDFQETWWHEYEVGGKRDQYSFTYAAYLNQLKIQSMGQHDPRLIKEFFDYHSHTVKRKITLRLIIRRLLNRLLIAISFWGRKL